MVTVGIRNLKDSLSEYLRMVKAGERIVITDHNKIIAEIIPASASNEKAERLEKYLREQTELGKLSPATKRTSLNRERTTGKQIDQKQINSVYERTRNDRQ